MDKTVEPRQQTRQFLDDLATAREVYGKLIALTRDQSRILQSGLSDDLVELAGRKSTEMARLAEVEERMRATRASWDRLKLELSEAERTEVKRAVAEVEAVLRELIELEQRENCTLEKHRRETVEEIQRVDKTRRVNRAYGASLPTRAGSLDQRK